MVVAPISASWHRLLPTTRVRARRASSYEPTTRHALREPRRSCCWFVARISVASHWTRLTTQQSCSSSSTSGMPSRWTMILLKVTCTGRMMSPRSSNEDSWMAQVSFNSLWPSDAVWRLRSGSTLAQVMACCLTAPSHYLNRNWLISNEVQWQSLEGNFTRDTSAFKYIK